MAKDSIAVINSEGVGQSGKTVTWYLTGTDTPVASTNGSLTGETVTVTDNGDGTYTTTGSYLTYLSDGDLITGTYDIKVDGVLQPEFTGRAHIDPADALGSLKASQNLADLGSPASARGNLGLGNSATKDVGSGSGQVAAGDHNHDSAYASLSHNHSGVYQAYHVGLANWGGLVVSTQSLGDALDAYVFPVYDGDSESWTAIPVESLSSFLGGVLLQINDDDSITIPRRSTDLTANEANKDKMYIRKTSSGWNLQIVAQDGDSSYTIKTLASESWTPS